jgi:hypothetical protein
MAQQDLSISELVSKIERGEIRLPEMQRQYVWRSTRVRDLLDSLYRGYPSGTILTWETDGKVPTRDFAVSQEENKQQNYQLLLDGQQRLTSLSAIIRGEPIHVRGRKRPIDVLFNLEHPEEIIFAGEYDEEADEDTPNLDSDEVVNEDELSKLLNKKTFVLATNKLASQPHWVSVTEVFKESNDAVFLRKAGATSFDDPRAIKYSERLKKLRSIKDYMYRVHILERSKSYEEVTEIFVRVNSLGAKLRSSDLALAQITAAWPNSLEIFQEYQEKCKTIGFDFELAIYLKMMIALATGQSRFRTVSSLSRDELENSWVAAKESMNFALNFIRSNLHIDSPALLSSPFLIITIAYFAHYKGYKLSPDDEKLLKQWILSANLKGRYSRGSTESILDQDLGAIKNNNGDLNILVNLVRAQAGRLEIEPTDLEYRNSRSPYFKTMFMAFKKDGAKDWNDQLVISIKHSGSQHSLQFHHIFPQDVLKKAGYNKQLINDISNLAFIGGKTNRKISNKEPSKYLADLIASIGEDTLNKQCIPNNPNLWSIDKYPEFLAERRKLISEKLNSYIKDMLG